VRGVWEGDSIKRSGKVSKNGNRSYTMRNGRGILGTGKGRKTNERKAEGGVRKKERERNRTT